MPKVISKPIPGKPKPPKRPYPDFPLFPHANGQWCKKIRGKQYHFGVWADPDAALKKYELQRDDLHAGRKPRTSPDGLTVRELANKFEQSKRHLRDTLEIAARTYVDYFKACKLIVDAFGTNRLVSDLGPDDFEALRVQMAKRCGPVRLANEIQRVRAPFKYAFDQGLIDRPIRYGQSFNKPSKRVLRQTRQAAGKRMFEPSDIRAILGSASPAMKAMTLLGINCGFGNTDVASLPLPALDLKAGWVNFPRPKTAIERRVRLWPETVKALKAAIAARPTARSESDKELVFITKYGKRWVRFDWSEGPAAEGEAPADARVDSVSLEFKKLLNLLGLKRKGLGFYALRHTFETVGGESIDQVAVDAIMGHAPADHDMAARYRQELSDDRLKAVTDYVRKWLFAKAKPKAKRKSERAA
jgi:integrase